MLRPSIISSTNPTEIIDLTDYFPADLLVQGPGRAPLLEVSDKSVKEDDSFHTSHWKYHYDLMKRVDKKDDLVKELYRLALDTNNPMYWDTHNALKYCKVDWKVIAGLPVYNFRLCRRKGCPVCSHKYRCERRSMLYQVSEWIEKLVQDGELIPSSFYFNTLTYRHYRNSSPEREMDRLDGYIKKFIETSWFRTRYRNTMSSGYVMSIEVTKTSEYWNFHIHFIGYSSIDESEEEHRKGLSKTWRRVGGGRTDVQELILEESSNDISGESSDLSSEISALTKSSIIELVKYTVKHNECSITDLAKIIASTKRRRFYRTGGIFKSMIGFIKDLGNPIHWNKEKEEDKEIPLPPSKVNPDTGEVAEMVDGALDPIEAMYKGYVLGDWSHQWSFQMMNWVQKYFKPALTNEHKRRRLLQRLKSRKRIDQICDDLDAKYGAFVIRDNEVMVV